MGVLTEEQVRQYEAEGYLLVSGLIAPEIAARGQAALWQALGADPNDRATWKDLPSFTPCTHPDLAACFTPQMQAAAAQLAGEDPANLHLPTSVSALNAYPQEGPWTHHGPHIDHAIKAHGHKTFPRPLRVASLTYLNEVRPHGGATIVWPGSHKKIETLARSDPDRFEMMWVLNEAIHTLDLGAPMEVPARCGDVLFYHYLCAHSGSRNIMPTPRFALPYKW